MISRRVDDTMMKLSESEFCEEELVDERFQLKNYLDNHEEYMVWEVYDCVLARNCELFICHQDDEACIAQFFNEMYQYKIVLSQTIWEQCVIIAFVISETEPETSSDELIEQVEYTKKAKRLSEVLPAGTWLCDKYKIVGVLGCGGFGITYLCIDKYLQRNVVIKEYFPEAWAEREEHAVVVKTVESLDSYMHGKTAFYYEIRISAQYILNEHIITIYDAFEENDTVYLVMEYLPGKSVSKLLKEREDNLLTLEETLDIVKPIANALGQVHAGAVIHRDISPSNIIVNDKKVTLIDFGSARNYQDKQILINSTFIKRGYAAPEQYQTIQKGQMTNEGPWTDVYALGATMYTMLYGKLPLSISERLNDTRFKIKKRKKNGVSKMVCSLLYQCLELPYQTRIKDMSLLYKKLCEL